MDNHCFKLDPEKVDLIEKKLGSDIKVVINNYLELLVNNNSVEGNLLVEMAKKQKELDNLKKDYFTIQNKESLVAFDDLGKPFESVNRINNSCGKVGRNQIRRLAKSFHVSALSLEKLCEDKGIALVNYL